MSSAPPATTPTQDKGKEKEKKGVGKLLARMKTVLKKGESSRRFSIVGSKSTKRRKLSIDLNDSTAEPVEEKPEPKPEPEGVTKVPRSQIYEQRAKQLGERFGLQLYPGDWYSTEGDALRVEKPIRMRVRRNCHLCNSTFGVAKECPNCQHVRCKHRERRAAKAKELEENPPIAVDYCFDDKTPELRIPAKCGKQDLVYKKPRQRVRRNCHECGTLFKAGSKLCTDCGHIRCTDCPRDPAKKKKYPFGYPGDEYGPTAVPHHECHQCKSIFPGGAADGTACQSCQHPKCESCQRLKPRRVEPQPDPDVLKSVEEKLAQLKVGG
ncbi:unnamed protein product [Parascedosporium putredinis]|uniref:Uncharacterized protein n=1 Tax=Parascedosporium putredinis TaxID=1442378 RepID=A0A9P1GV87_9PEZI|nr:unnamed protein product [Parascedosporium putredinis]CAI7987743.1 unnamed protein product [Parascedosporium putredinis]